ncbi:hypothetical protein F5Y16DRAFT_292138 [Xylariaceae sp. FL0255]|nr:hypothetical protein F5Y16DRAFT_292138 [Xylariaceae sp. FL0255]
MEWQCFSPRRQADDILPPIFESLKQSAIIQSEAMQAIQKLLQKIPSTPITELAHEMAEDDSYKVICDNDEETVVEFEVKSRIIRLMAAKDIDKDAIDPYGQTKRARRSKERMEEAFNEPPMSISQQQLVMAKILQESDGHLGTTTGFFTNLRSLAQERFWLLDGPTERMAYRKQALEPPTEDLSAMLTLVRANWQDRWDNGRDDPDFFYHYARDQAAALSAWDLVTADLFVVTDRNNQVVFAHCEELAQMLYGKDTVDRLLRALDLWSYYVPLPAPDSRRHVVDRYIRRIHPELNLDTATVSELPQAKMAVAHLGCWTPQGHSSGKFIMRTADALFDDKHH